MGFCLAHDVGALMERSARFSDCRRYRYALWRGWPGLFPEDERYVMFIGLNPSRADEYTDDPTVRRCIAFTRDWGFQGMYMTNLFAYRATLPADMKAVADPVGSDNDRTLCEIAAGAGLVVAAWGIHGAYRGRGAEVAQLLPDLHCLHLTKEGFPGHPLYLKKDARPTPWQGVSAPAAAPSTGRQVGAP